MKSFTLFVLLIFSFIGVFAQKKIKSHNTIRSNNRVFTLDSVPLNGFYKIKYTDFSNDWKKEISHFNNGFRTGVSKILRYNKLEKEGTYVKGIKHGKWKEYLYTTGKLNLTSEYKNGKKHGREFGQTFENGKFIANYINDSINGPLLKYNSYNGYLDIKEYYKNGKLLYIHKYDDFLNIIRENNFFYKNDTLLLEVKTEKLGKTWHLDSLFYNNQGKDLLGKSIPYKIKKYENNELITSREIMIKKDTTRNGEDDYVLITNSYDNNTRKASAFIYYNSKSLIRYTLQNIKRYIMYDDYSFYPCFISDALIFEIIQSMTFYVKYENEEAIYEIEFNPEKMGESDYCDTNTRYGLTKFKQSY